MKWALISMLDVKIGFLFWKAIRLYGSRRNLKIFDPVMLFLGVCP